MSETTDAVARIDARLAADPNRRLVMKRHFKVSPERVFDAWTDPRIAGRWLFTGPTSQTHEIELDVRVGGKWRIMDRRDGTDYTAIGEYLEVDRPRRLVFTFGMPMFSPEFDRIIVEVEPDGDGALMTMIQEGIMPEAKDPTEEGWGWMFKGLEAVLG
jgi:uncharacterized protein YndB with AHSA1/START domain